MKNLNDVKSHVMALWNAKQNYKRAEEHLKEVTKKESLFISNFMFANLPSDEKSFLITLDEGVDYYSNHVTLKVTNCRTKKILWLIDKVKQNLTKDQQKMVLKKQYVINDIDGLVEYLKSCGVNPKKFKTFITVFEEMNEQALEQAYELGDIKRKQLNGCYQVKIGEPYFRLTEIKK